jgi:hypothetical protein
MQCLPLDRVWPTKCERCAARGLPCDAPQTKGAKWRHTTGGQTPGSSRSRARFVLGSASKPRRAFDESEDEEESEKSASETSSQAMALEPSVPAKVPNLTPRKEVPSAKMVSIDTIRSMEDEFAEVLRQMEHRHSGELEAQKETFEHELKSQRDKYERRVDDLIQIIKNAGQPR